MTTMPRHLAFAALIAALGAARAALAQEQAPQVEMGFWNGSFRNVQMGGSGRYSGTAKISPLPGKPANYRRVELRLSTPGGSSLLEWSASPGRCGSIIQPVKRPGELPSLETRSAGSAELTFEGALFDFKGDSAYQLMVFKDGAKEQNMVACANLKYAVPRP